MKNNTYILILLGIIMISSLPVFAQENAGSNISEEVTIEIIKNVKSAVTFAHKKHVDLYKAKCRDCHHRFRKKDGAPKQCVECHAKEKRKLIDGRRAPLIMNTIMQNIYHDKCNECHDKVQRGGKPFPRKCSVCHPLRRAD